MNQPGLNIVFAGTPEFGLPALEALFASTHSLIAVYTQPDRPSGRGQHLQFSPIKQWAVKHNVPVYQPTNFRTPQSINELRALTPDLMVVIAYGLILPRAVLDIPKLGCINVHSSLLPAWRGAAPIQSALLHGDKNTGISIMQMDAGMDTGPILRAVSTPIYPTDTAGSLHDRLSLLSPAPLLEVIAQAQVGQLQPVAQTQALATYSKKIQKEDAAIQWEQPAQEIEQMIRAYYPWPIAHTMSHTHRIRIFEAEVDPYQGSAKPGEIIKIDTHGMSVATGRDALRIKQFQFPGGKILHVSDWRHACSPPLLIGQRLV